MSFIFRMGAGQSKVVPIHIPVEEWVPQAPRKAKRRWRKNFKLLSLLSCNTARPITTDNTRQTIPACPTPALYGDEPYNITLSLVSVPSSPMTTSNHYPTLPHPDSQFASNGQRMRTPFSCTSVSGQCGSIHHHSRKEKTSTELRKTTTRAIRPSTVLFPKPRPRTPVIEQRDFEAQPERYTPVICSWNTDDSYNVAVGIPGDSPVNISGHVIDSFFSPTEVMMDELLTCFVSQQDEYPNPPRGSLLLPLGDSFDSLDSYTQLRTLAGLNYDGSSSSDSEDHDAPLPYACSLSPTIAGTGTNLPRPRAAYGLPRGADWCSASPHTTSPSITCQRSNYVAEAQVRCSQCERKIVMDESKKREPMKKRILAAFRRFRRTSNLIHVSEAKEVVDNSGRTEATEANSCRQRIR